MVMKVPSSSIIETSSVEISVLLCFFGTVLLCFFGILSDPVQWCEFVHEDKTVSDGH
jgi:hypothetical protein